MTCPRCTGYVYVDLDDTRCLLCGFRPTLTTIPPVYRTEEVPTLEQHGEKVHRGMRRATRLCRYMLHDGQLCLALCREGNYYYCDAHRRRKRTRTRTVGTA